jgi:hypothetical protein
MFASAYWTYPCELMKVALLSGAAVLVREKVNRESIKDIWVKSRDSVEPSLASSAG